MSQIIEVIDVDVPVRTAYDQWTQFETFPLFMEGVEQVVQVDDTTLVWRARIAGITKEWEAKITEQTPDERIAWSSVEGAMNAGTVTFHTLDDHRAGSPCRSTSSPAGRSKRSAMRSAWSDGKPGPTSRASRSSSRRAARRPVPGAVRWWAATFAEYIWPLERTPDMRLQGLDRRSLAAPRWTGRTF